MRVFQLNDYEAYCGNTLLQALRAARKQTGCGFRDLFDRDAFREVPPNEWEQKTLRDGDSPTDKTTLAKVMQGTHAPGLVYSSEI